MDNPRAEKVAVVTEVRERFQRSSAAILTEYRGLSVKDLAGLRRTLRDAGSEYKIYKNTLVRFAAADLGLDGLQGLLIGPTAIAFVDGDASSVAKALREYARTNPKLTVKGGVLGTKVISVADATALADLPPREVVLARLAGALAAPMQTFAGLLQAVPRSFAYGLRALLEKRGGVEEAAGAEGRDGDLAGAAVSEQGDESAVGDEVADEDRADEPATDSEDADEDDDPAAPPYDETDDAATDDEPNVPAEVAAVHLTGDTEEDDPALDEAIVEPAVESEAEAEIDASSDEN